MRACPQGQNIFKTKEHARTKTTKPDTIARICGKLRCILTYVGKGRVLDQIQPEHYTIGTLISSTYSNTHL